MEKQISDREFEDKAKEYKNLAYSITSKFNMSEEDRKSCYYLALLKALKNFKPVAKFSTYLSCLIRYECLRRYKENMLIKVDGGERVELNSLLADENELDKFYTDVENSGIANKEILIDHIFFKHTLKEIGSKYGFSYETARKKLLEAQDALDIYLNEQF